MSNILISDKCLKNIKMVTFDKDGTLIDIHYYWCSMIKFRAHFIVESLKHEIGNTDELYNDLVSNMGIDTETNKMKSEGPVGLKSRGFIENVALNTILKYTDNYSAGEVKDIFKQVDEYSKIKLADIVQPLIGAGKLLKSLIDNGVLVSIATTDITSRAELAMKALSFENYFVDIVGADLVENAKPSPDLLEFIAAKHNLTPEDILVIGDSMADLKMAQNYTCNFIGVKTGLITDEFITESKYIIENLEEIKVEK